MVSSDVARVCEFLAHWIGGVTHAELGKLLGYTPRRLLDLLGDGFERLGRCTVAYDASAKRHCTVVPTEALHGPRRVSEVVATLQAARLWNGLSGQEMLCPLADIRDYRRDPAPDTFRTLLTACTRRQVVDVTYLAKTRQHTVLFSPHTLVTGTYRVHFRGYSVFEQDGKWDWWDLVPSRVLQAELRPSSGYVGDGGDAEWHDTALLTLWLRPELEESVRSAIRREHGLDGDQLVIQGIRKALLPYVAADYLDRRYHGFEGPVWRYECSL